jgi:hypothetical protein
VALVVSGVGGPSRRRKQKADPLAISPLEESEEAANAGEVGDERSGRNLANVFPFVGGERGELAVGVLRGCQFLL